jgi:hypothetical protein
MSVTHVAGRVTFVHLELGNFLIAELTQLLTYLFTHSLTHSMEQSPS